ncbi:hypothetical protein ARTHROSP310_24200 [Arthrobacter sp. AD-310]
MAFQQGEIQLPLGREVLVQDRLADMGGFGDFVHGGAVVAVGDEHFLGCGKKLGTPLVTGKPGGSLACRARGILRLGGGRAVSPCFMDHGYPLSSCGYLHFTAG